MAEEKIIERIRKLFAIAEGVTSDANSDEIKETMANEAMAAAQMAEKLLFKYKLSRADVVKEEEYVEEIIPVFGYTIVPDFIKRAGAKAPSQRKIWFERLAEVVAEGYFCKSAPRPDTKEVVFYGLDMDREIAIYVFTRLAESAHELSKIEWKKAERAAGTVNFETLEEIPYLEEPVFFHNFHAGFREAIRESYINRMDEESDQAKEIFAKAQQETIEYFNSVRDRRRETGSDHSHEEIDESQWAVEVGKKAGSKASTRINTMAGDAGAIQKTAKKFETGEVFILIDKSGSMYGDKLAQAKNGAIDYAMQAIEKKYSVGVIAFGWTAELIIEPQNEIGLTWHNAVSRIKSSGSTDLTGAINQAKSRFRNSRQKRVICIITDGWPDNKESALTAAIEAKKTGIEIFAIGTDDADKNYLDQLTDMKGIKVVAGELRTGIRSMAGLLPAAN